MTMIDLSRYAAFLFDLDGTLWTGSELYDGALELVRFLADSRRRIVIVSNNSVLTGDRVVADLAARGLEASLQAVTVTDVAGEFVRAHGCRVVRVVGAVALARVCRDAGLDVVDPLSERRADAILLGRDVSFTYELLERLAARAADGELLIATNEDAYHPGPGGSRVPETGALLAAIRTVAGCDYLSVGKPGPLLFDRALERAGVSSRDAVMIGDNLDTDVAGAVRAGMDAIWISLDRTAAAATEPPPVATYPTLREFAVHCTGSMNGTPATALNYPRGHRPLPID